MIKEGLVIGRVWHFVSPITDQNCIMAHVLNSLSTVVMIPARKAMQKQYTCYRFQHGEGLQADRVKKCQ